MRLSKLGIILNLAALCLVLYGIFGRVAADSNIAYILMVLLLIINIVGIVVYKRNRS